MNTRLALFAALLSLPGTLALAGNTPSTTVQGTNQLAGGDAKLNQTVTLYPGTSEAMNFTLKSAEYAVGHWLTADKNDFLPKAGEKLLILHATIQNPQKGDHAFRGDHVAMTGVDSKNTEVKPEWSCYDEKTHAVVEMTFKPAQKLDVIYLMKLDATVSLPKLIVNTSNNKVWRYDLRGQIKGLAAPYADPASKDSSVALDTIAAKPGTYYNSLFDVRLDKVEYVTQPMLDREVPEAGRLMLVTVTYRNPLPTPQLLQGWTLKPKVFDQDDMEAQNGTNGFLAGRDQEVDGNIAPGKEITLRYVVPVTQGTEPKRLELAFDGGRTFSYDISTIK